MNPDQGGKDHGMHQEMLEAINELESKLPARFDVLSGENLEKLLAEADNNKFLKDTEALIYSMLSQQRLRSVLTKEINSLLREVKKFFAEGEVPVYDKKTKALLVSMMRSIKNMSQILEDFEPDISLLKASLRRSIEAMDKFLSSEEE